MTMIGVRSAARAGGARIKAPHLVLMLTTMITASLGIVKAGSASLDMTLPCRCPKQLAPVCDTATQTSYDNLCFAVCAGVGQVTLGACRQPQQQGCICPAIYNPVCGVDGVTYPSKCDAACKGVKVMSPGTCESNQLTAAFLNCMCAPSTQPVCASNNQTLPSSCEAGCLGLTVAYEGECLPGQCDACPTAKLLPVCANEQTFPNPCVANCSGQPNYAIGACPSDCVCAQIYQPVCGRDGKTYGNACEASCAGVGVLYDGPCSKQGCFCNTTWAPVCGVDGATYASACVANCTGTRIAFNGTCEGADAFINPKSDCYGTRDLQDPVCALRKGDNRTVQFKNGCYARVAGINITTGDRIQRGPCTDSCVDQCQYALDDGQPLCCGTKGEFINACYAHCLANVSVVDIATCTHGLCKGQQAAALLDNAPCTNPEVLCFNPNPCKGAACPADPSAQCVNMGGCSKFHRLTRLNALCGTYWVSQAGDFVPGCGQLL